MAKFAKGDKVVSVKSGAKGVVDEVYGEEKYAVLFDGAANPDRVEGFQIKAANGCAKNAKFKVGDRVRDTEAMRDGVIVEVDAEKPGYYAVKYDARPQPQWNVPESYLTLANAAPVRSTNSIVQNAISARTARNATKLMTLIPSKDGNKLNDFIHYAYFKADGNWKEGDIPYVRKDMLIKGLEKELDRAKTTMRAIEDALKQAKEI